MADKKLKITLVKSTIGAVPKNKAIVESMGLRKIALFFGTAPMVDFTRVIFNFLSAILYSFLLALST